MDNDMQSVDLDATAYIEGSTQRKDVTLTAKPDGFIISTGETRIHVTVDRGAIMSAAERWLSATGLEFLAGPLREKFGPTEQEADAE